MQIDQNIIDGMKKALPAKESGGIEHDGLPINSDNETVTLLDNPAITLPALRGSPAQIKWANKIRQDALALEWPPDKHALLCSVTSAPWWIANKNITFSLKFNPPALAQTAGGEQQPELPAKPPYTEGPRVSDFGPINTSRRANDAHLWAHSVSQTPKLAEAAILSVLSRLYKEPMKATLRAKAYAVLNDCEQAAGKDADAIHRMLEMR